MIHFGKKEEESVGLDIGTYSVKVVSVKSTAERPTLTAYNIKNIPYGLNPGEIKNIIKETLNEIDLHPEDVNLGFSGPSVIVRFIDLPRMTKDQLSSALAFEAEKYIPFNVNEVVMDHMILGDSGEEGKMRVLLAAAKKDMVQARVDLMEDLGIGINVLDIDSLAAFNAFVASNEPDEKGSVFFHFGHSQTDVLVSVKDVPYFMRQIQIGGNDIEAAFAKQAGIEGDEARDRIMKGQLESEEELPGQIVSILDEMIREMQLSFGYFENRYNISVDTVYCSGGLMARDALLKYLCEKTGFEMRKWDPIAGLDVSDLLSREDIMTVGPQLAVSIGLALRG